MLIHHKPGQRLSGLSYLCVFCLLLSGCTGKNLQVTHPSVGPNQVSVENALDKKVEMSNPTANLSLSESVTFTDFFGRTVSVKKNPERVAALLGSFADTWLLAGGSVCAAPEDAWNDFHLTLNSAQNIGGTHSPSLELLLSANPDFVLASAAMASNMDMRETLEKAGIPVAYFKVDKFDDYLHMLNICTDITGRKDLYKKNGLEIQTQIELLKKQYAEQEVSEKARKILLLRASSRSIKAKGSEGSVLGEMLADLGCINIADSDHTILDTLSVEAILRQDPSHIFMTTMGDQVDVAVNSLNSLIKENPAWNSLTAVKTKRLHLMDKALFNQKPNARWADAYRELYEILIKQ